MTSNTLRDGTPFSRDAYPFVIRDASGVVVDAAANVDSAVSVLYGDLGARDEGVLTVEVPPGDEWEWHALMLEQAIAENADCWGIPADHVERR